MSTSVEIILDYPVEYGGVIYRTLTIRPPTGLDLVRAKERSFSKFGTAATLISILSNTPRKVALDLELVDAAKIEAFLDANWIK